MGFPIREAKIKINLSTKLTIVMKQNLFGHGTYSISPPFLKCINTDLVILLEFIQTEILYRLFSEFNNTLDGHVVSLIV